MIKRKKFEDYFSKLQADMVSICLEYVEKRAEKIYIYCSCENGVIFSGFFYKIGVKIVHKHRLNDALENNDREYDVSIIRQKKAINIINRDIEELKKLCQKYKRDMPTQIKLTYDIGANKLNADYSYDLIYSDDADKISDDVFEEWYQVEKNNEEQESEH